MILLFCKQTNRFRFAKRRISIKREMCPNVHHVVHLLVIWLPVMAAVASYILCIVINTIDF